MWGQSGSNTGSGFKGWTTADIQGHAPIPRVALLTRLVVSRSLGDKCATKLGVICEPEVVEFTLNQDDKYMVLATDGVWDGISIDEAAAFLKQNENIADAALKLTQYAEQQLHKKNLDDNVTAIVVGLTNGKLAEN